jgi:hypothetical protein
MNVFPIFPIRCGKAGFMEYAGSTRLLFILNSLICFSCMSVTVLAQTQLGSDIDGAVSQLASNYSVSLSADGNRLAIGADNHDGNGSRSGHTRVYHWSGTEWAQLGSDIDGEGAEDYSGCSVALSSDGSRVAIGADGNDDNGDESGHVRVYHWSGMEWAQLGSDIVGEAAGDQSGISVSLSSDGNRLAIGAPGNDDHGSNSGHARVYQWTGSAWTQLGADIDGEAAWDTSGSSVALASDGSHLAIGAPLADGNDLASGQVRVYYLSGSEWVQRGFTIEGEKENNFSGHSVSLSSDGGRLAIGAPFNDGNGRWSGHTRVYEWSGTAWSQAGADIDGESAEDRSGSSVSLSSDGSRLVIGAPRNGDNSTNTGHVRVYRWSGTDWTQLGADIDGEEAGDQFGYHVSLSADGNRVAGGTGYANETGVDPGYVQVYDIRMFNVFNINPGLNDAWYNPATNGQGFLITVFPDIKQLFLAWFTFDTERPPENVSAHLGEPGHRWLTAQGPYDGDTANLVIYLTQGGVFDSPQPAASVDLNGYGSMTLEFADCENGLVNYVIPTPGLSGEIPIQRMAPDNIPICESLGVK